jgi:hypothetical protein
MIYSYEEFIEYYKKHNRFPVNIYWKAGLNDKQLKTKYKKYLSVVEKSKEKKKPKKKAKVQVKNTDREKDNKIKLECLIRANNECEILPIICQNYSEEQVNQLTKTIFSNIDFQTLDPVHIVSRRYKNARWDSQNILIGYRYIHSMIDQYINPVTGEKMTKQQRDDFFIMLIGQERWDYLQEKKRGCV